MRPLITIKGWMVGRNWCASMSGLFCSKMNALLIFSPHHPPCRYHIKYVCSQSLSGSMLCTHIGLVPWSLRITGCQSCSFDYDKDYNHYDEDSDCWHWYWWWWRWWWCTGQIENTEPPSWSTPLQVWHKYLTLFQLQLAMYLFSLRAALTLLTYLMKNYLFPQTDWDDGNDKDKLCSLLRQELFIFH